MSVLTPLSSGFSLNIYMIKQGYFFLRIPSRSAGQDARKGLIGILAARGWAMEELVTEIGTALLCADLGITPETMEDHSAYITSWLKVLKKYNR
jgi:hypothetical protein